MQFAVPALLSLIVAVGMPDARGQDVDRQLAAVDEALERLDEAAALEAAAAAVEACRTAGLAEDEPRSRRAATLLAMLRSQELTMAGTQRAATDPETAAEHFRQAMELSSQAVQTASELEPDGTLHADALLRAAIVQLHTGRQDDARESFERAAAMTEAARPRRLAQCWLARLDVHTAGAAPLDYAPLIAEAGNELPGHPVEYQLQVQLFLQTEVVALLQQASGIIGSPDGEQSWPRFQQHLEERERAWRDAGLEPEIAAAVYLAPLTPLIENNRWQEAGRYLDRLRASERSPRVAPLARALIANQFALHDLELGNLASAHDRLDFAQTEAGKAGEQVTRYTVRINLGWLAIRRGDADEAVYWLRDAMEDEPALEPQLENLVSQRVRLRLNLARALAMDGEAEQARHQNEQALDLARQGGSPAINLSMCLNALAIDAFARGDLDAAEVFLQEAREAAAQGSESAPLIAELAVNQAWIAFERGELEPAAEQFRSAGLRAAEQYDADHMRVAEALAHQARCQADLGRTEQARALLDEAIDRREAYLDRILRSSLTERDRLAFVQELRIHAEAHWPGVLDTYLELAPRLDIPAHEQYERVLAWKNAAARHSLHELEALASLPEAQELLESRRRCLQELRLLYFQATAGASELALERRARMQQLEREANDIEHLLRSGSRPDDNAAVDPTTDGISGTLRRDEVLLDVLQYRIYTSPRDIFGADSQAYVGFLVRPSGEVIRVDFDQRSSEGVKLDDLATRLLTELESEGDHLAASKGLHEMIYGPLAPHLKEVNRLILAADGGFHRIPLAALTDDGNRFWGQSMTFVRVPAAASLLRRHPARPRSGMLALGDVTFDDPDTYEPLEGTRAEVDALGSLFRRYDVDGSLTTLTGTEATKARLLAVADECGILHLATHGRYVDARGADDFQVPGLVDQLRSRLVLARPEGTEEDERFLTADEMSRLDLQGTRLVVLSACQSGLGYVSAGQQTVGMMSALDRAGAQSVVASLWKVDDVATRHLMETFYRGLWNEDLEPSEALARAQREMLEEPDGEFRHPRYWAAFVISGR